MLYRILALAALFFFTACGGGPRDIQPDARKPVSQTVPGTFVPGAEQPVMPQPEPPGAAVRTVKVGLLVPLTGEAAAAGAALQDAATLALMDKYGYGGSAQDVRVVLVPKDTQGTPAGAAAAAQAVLDSGAQLIVGPLFSQNVAAVAPIAKQRGVNVLTFSNNPSVAGDNVFVFGFLVDQQVKRVLNYALNHNFQRTALLAPNNPYGASVKSTATGLLQSSGLKLAEEHYYNPASMPVVEIGRLSASHAVAPFDSVFIPEGGKKLEHIVQALAERGIAQPGVQLLGTGLWDEPAILRAGALSGGWFASSPPDRVAAYERRFREFFGYAPPRISALAYDAMALAASLAVQKPDGAFTIEAMTDPAGYNGPVNGIFRCGQTGICERGLAVLEATGKGIAKVVDPAPKAF